jgi:hypothetical protein
MKPRTKKKLARWFALFIAVLMIAQIVLPVLVSDAQ